MVNQHKEHFLMSDLLARLDTHEFPQKDVLLCLSPKLLDDRDSAMARVASANRKKKTTVDDDRMTSPSGPSPELAAALDDVKRLNDEIQAASITIRITGVDRLAYNRLMLTAPPRHGKNEAFDPSKFYINAAKATGAYVDANGEQHPITPEEWAAIDKKLSDGEYDRLAQAVIAVNRTVGGQDVSFFANVSETTPDSSETSD